MYTFFFFFLPMLYHLNQKTIKYDAKTDELCNCMMNNILPLSLLLDGAA